jgi:hypothetical protein
LTLDDVWTGHGPDRHASRQATWLELSDRDAVERFIARYDDGLAA